MDTTTRSITYGGDTLRVLGSTPARLTGGLTAWLERIHPDDRDGFRLALEHVISTQQPFHHSYRLRGADGSFLDVQDDGYCVLDSQHNLAQIIGFVVDVTVRKRNEARMAEQMDELRRWQQVTLGREGRVLAIKQEVNSLLTELGRPPRYGQDPTVKP